MSPIFVAIDTPDLSRAKAIAQAVRGVAGGLKLGLEFFTANGPAGVSELSEFGLPIFLDLKLHDIPNTVAKAVQALAPLEPAILTVHAAGGMAMLENAKAAASPKTRVVAVTVLTSLDQKDLAAAGIGGSPAPRFNACRTCPNRRPRRIAARAKKWARFTRPAQRFSSCPAYAPRATELPDQNASLPPARKGPRRIDLGDRPPNHRRR